MIKRLLAERLLEAAKVNPIITLTGPRQSGKTTLAKDVFGSLPYVTLEDPDVRQFALTDPRGFLKQFPDGGVLDEAQRVPELFSYLQGVVDADSRPGRFVLTGSQNFHLMSRVSQSLAGRCAVFHLLPLSRAELTGRQGLDPDRLGTVRPARWREESLAAVLHSGFYPRIHDRKINAHEWLGNYYQTYLERDVRDLVHVGDIEMFNRFVRLCAGRSGQLLNVSSLAVDAGISHTTAQRWLSILQASFVVYLLRPHHRNFNKRLVKSPKLYFLDTGLLCYLLRVRAPNELTTHPFRGAIFETFVVAELIKAFLHAGREADIYFWRDSSGHEVDVLVEGGSRLTAIEVKSGETVAPDFFAGLAYWRQLVGDRRSPACLVYGGDASAMREDVAVYAWAQWG